MTVALRNCLSLAVKLNVYLGEQLAGCEDVTSGTRSVRARTTLLRRLVSLNPEGTRLGTGATTPN
jgi:hypothetical protein